MGYFEPVAYFTHLTKFYTIIRHSQHQFFVPTMSIQVSILKYILTESGGSILQCKNRNLKKELFSCLVTFKMAELQGYL